MRVHKLELSYDKSNKLFNEFVSKTNISTMEYEAFLLAPNATFQALCYIVKEVLYENLYPDPFKREFVKCPDGGTIGLDWDGEIPDHTQPLSQPLLVIAPGLGGGTHNLYTISMLQKARSQGFKVVTIVFRGAEGLPITVPKLSYSGSSQDMETALDFICKRYVNDPKTGKRQTRVYAFGCSLGANILGLYLGKAGQKALTYLDGAGLYACPWSTEKGSKHFYENNRIFSWVIGMNLNRVIKSV